MPDPHVCQQREQIIQALLEIEQSLDFDRLSEVFPHPRYELIGNNRVYDGMEVCARYLKERRSAFPDYRAEVIAIFHADDAVIAEAWVTGTHTGRIEDIEASGKGFRFRAAAFFLFDGATLVCFRNYFDHATIARQLA